MRRTNLLPQPYRLVVVLLCLFPIGQFSAVPDNKETARQTAADANEHALTLPERQEALTKLNEAARQFIDAGETVEAARTLNRVGRLQSLLNEPHDALESFQHALALLNKASVAEVKIDSLNGQAVALIFVQELVRAEMVLKKSLLLSNQTGYTAGKAQALLTLSDAQNYKNHALAMETAQSALVLWESLRNREGIARTFAQIGRCYMAQNMLLEATQNYGKALQIWRELNNPSEQARVLIMFGFIEYRKAEWQSSISYLTQAQGLIDESAEPVMRGQIAAGLAEAFNESGMPETGLGHFQDALESYRKSKDPHLVMIANRGLGVTYAYLGKYPEALDHLHQALVGLKPDSLNAAQNYEPIGMIHLKTGDSAVALKYLRLALSIYEKAANPKEAAQVKALMARVFEQQGQLERARHHYQQALKTFVESLDRQNQADALYGLGRLELRAGNLDTAEHYIKQSIAFTEDMRRVSRGSDLAAAFSATVYERYQTYIDCLMRQHHAHPDRGYAALALETSELARARSLSEMLSSTATAFAPGVDPQLVAQEKSLSQSLRVKENSKIRMLGGKYKREGLASLENELARLEQD